MKIKLCICKWWIIPPAISMIFLLKCFWVDGWEEVISKYQQMLNIKVISLHPISSFHLFVRPLSLGLIPSTVSNSLYGGTSVNEVLLAGPISSGYRWRHNPLLRGKIAWVYFQKIVCWFQWHFLKNHIHPLCKFYFVVRQKLLASAGIELWSCWKQFTNKWTLASQPRHKTGSF